MGEVNKWIVTVITVSFSAGLIKKLFPDKKNAALELMLSLAIMVTIISPLLKLQSGIDITKLNLASEQIDSLSLNDAFNESYIKSMELNIKGRLEKRIKESFFKKTGVTPSKIELMLNMSDISDVKIDSIRIFASGQKESFITALNEITKEFECLDTELM